MRRVQRFVTAAALVLATVTGSAVTAASPASAAVCRESSAIPQTSYFQLRSSDGRYTISIQRGIQNRQQFVRVWLNSTYRGAYAVPAVVVAGQVQAIYRTRTHMQIWMGQSQLVNETVAVLQVCGTSWIPVAFY